ncbi:PREDICTED: transcription cofactor vestigial-like protein 4 [Polistes dominula]|uniref:Transcription cofactor vestigial-like protein 4 n=1 Tax=Polistes dominula TaxID=743375 RepID=A0ABM1I9K0_POLDO|nr:PREDICTED: transcription cofactor vestigial-like protein 4 [Polistes dominula]
MSALESALDVLSRAATMVQEGGPKTIDLHRRQSSTRRKERRMDPIQNEALDMSTNKTVTTTYHRPSIIISPTSQSVRTNDWDTINRSESSSSNDTSNGRKTCSIYDSAIDEHFKRSLGAEKYAAVFHATGADKEIGLSVDDHFAKSLGDKWTTLKEPVNGRSSSNHVSVPAGDINSFPSFHYCPSCVFPDKVGPP